MVKYKITLKETEAKLSYIDDTLLFKAVKLSLWLILEQNASLKGAIESAQRKHSYPVKKHIEDHIRTAIPKEFFLQRQKDNRPEKSRMAAAKRNKEYGRETFQAKRHMKDIIDS